MRNTSIEDLRSKVIGYFSCVHGGKSESLVAELVRALQSGSNVVAYNPAGNTRDKNYISVNGIPKFPASLVDSVEGIKSDLEKRNETIMSRQVADQGEGDKIKIGEAEHRKYQPITVVGIDEVNLLCLTEKKATEMIDFMKWCRNESLVLYIAGLLDDFRQMPFGEVASILPYINIKYDDTKPACKSARRGKQCGEPAIHSMRLWSLKFVKEAGLEDLLGKMTLYDYADKEGEIETDKYVVSPFFDKTVRIEEASDGRNIYIPVCDDCLVQPFKEEVFQVYDVIVRNYEEKKDINPRAVLEPKLLNRSVINFLIDEGLVEGNARGKLKPVHYHRNRIGGFSPYQKDK